MDVTDPSMVESYLAKHNPEIIIHLAAMASIPGCEADRETAWKTNVESSRSLVELARENGNTKKFLYLQTACIFSGEDDFMYDEDSVPNPKHYYGLTKLVAEEIIKSYNSPTFQTIIARTNFTTMPWEYQKAFTDRF
jgi:dTDP-4-dehydrorhamnose reductase